MKPCTKCGQLHPPKLPCHLANATQDATLVNNDDAQKTIQHFGSNESEETEEARQTLQGMGPAPAEKTLFAPQSPLPTEEDLSAPTLFQSGKRETNAKAAPQDEPKTLFQPERSPAPKAAPQKNAKNKNAQTPQAKTAPKAAPSKAYPSARQPNRIQTPPPQPAYVPPQDAEELAPGQEVGGYTLEEYLGHGGMGEVWRAIQPKLKRKVAIKILDKNLASDPNLVARFEREAQTVNEIHHRNLVDISGFGELPGSRRPYLVMEYLEGRTLTQYLQERGQVPLFEIEPILEQLCDALGEAHRHNVIHRDIKPDNIFLVGQKTERPFLKILDFGLAKVVAENEQLTQTGEVFGTPEYMSPEQCKGAKNIDYRSDIYSLGIVLYEMICGRTPFAEPGDKRGQIWLKHVSQEPSSVTRFMNGRALPPGVDQVLAKALAKEPKDRYQDAQELFEAFRQITHNNKAAIKAADLVAQKPKFSPKAEQPRKDSDPPKAAFLAPGQDLPGVDRAALQEAKQRRIESAQQQQAISKGEKPKSASSQAAPAEVVPTDLIRRAKPSAEESDPMLPPAKKPFPILYLGLGLGGAVVLLFLLIKLFSGAQAKATPPAPTPTPAPQSAPAPQAPKPASSTAPAAPASNPQPASQPQTETPKPKNKPEKAQTPPPAEKPLTEGTLDPFKNKNQPTPTP